MERATIRDLGEEAGIAQAQAALAEDKVLDPESDSLVEWAERVAEEEAERRDLGGQEAKLFERDYREGFVAGYRLVARDSRTGGFIARPFSAPSSSGTIMDVRSKARQVKETEWRCWQRYGGRWIKWPGWTGPRPDGAANKGSKTTSIRWRSEYIKSVSI